MKQTRLYPARRSWRRSPALHEVPRRAAMDFDIRFFLCKAFLPYERGLSLFVEHNGEQMHIRMQGRDDAPGPVAQAFSDCVVEG